MKRWLRKNSGIIWCCFLILLFLGAVAFFSNRDMKAEDRCTNQGGITWDAGKHCLLKNGEIISTRGNIWGN